MFTFPGGTPPEGPFCFPVRDSTTPASPPPVFPPQNRPEQTAQESRQNSSKINLVDRRKNRYNKAMKSGLTGKEIQTYGKSITGRLNGKRILPHQSPPMGRCWRSRTSTRRTALPSVCGTTPGIRGSSGSSWTPGKAGGGSKTGSRASSWILPSAAWWRAPGCTSGAAPAA